MTLSLPKMQMCPVYRSWIWSICDRLFLSRFWDFHTDLDVSCGWATQRCFIFIIRWHSFTASLVWLRLPSLTRFYSISLWISGRNFLLVYDETPCSCMPCRSATHIITGQKRHFSRQRNSIHTCNLSLSLFLSCETISGSHQLHIHNLFHLRFTLLLNLLNVSPSLPLDHACCCNVHTFCTPSCQSDHQPFGLKLISLRWDHPYSHSRGWS